MTQQPLHAVGIDLGTTNSAVAIVAETGQTRMLENELGDTLTPSVVEFGDEEVVVGREALRALPVAADRVAIAAKRDIGQSTYSRQIRGQSLRPEFIEALILKSLKQQIATQLAGPCGTVITVPAYFDERRRQATRQAAEMAGLDLLAVINEPTAAALAFGESLGYLAERKTDAVPTTSPDQTLLVFDLGGGTFDATIVQLTPDTCTTQATDGDVRLGGMDWDMRLADYLAERFLEEHDLELRDQADLYQLLLLQAEEAKVTLSSRRHTRLPIEFLNKRLEITVTQQRFESLTEDLLERTIHTTREVLQAADKNWQDIDRILLVGGATRMPMVSERLREVSGRAPDRLVNPDEAVARGAAIHAWGMLSGRQQAFHPLRLHVIDVNSHSLGIEGINTETERRENAIIIPRNTPLPVEVTTKFVTRHDDQPSIVVHVLEGESLEPAECISVGRAVLRDLPPGLPAGSPLDVTYAYDREGSLKVRLFLPQSNRMAHFDIQRTDGLDDEGQRRWTEMVRNHDAPDG